MKVCQEEATSHYLNSILFLQTLTKGLAYKREERKEERKERVYIYDEVDEVNEVK
jgi:hypothetical protein